MSEPVIVPENQAVAEHLKQQAQPLVPKWAMALSGAISGIAVAVAPFLPHPYSTVAGVVALVAAFLACLPLPSPRFSRPVVPLSVVPLCLTAAEGLQALALALPHPAVNAALLLVAAVLAGVAGKVLPPPTK